jgi:hypothetical protein
MEYPTGQAGHMYMPGIAAQQLRQPKLNAPWPVAKGQLPARLLALRRHHALRPEPWNKQQQGK